MLKKLLFLIFLLFLSAVSATAILVFCWYRQWSPAWALIGPGVFLGLPLLWVIAKLVGGLFVRRGWSRRVGSLGLPAAGPRGRDFSILREEWQRGILAMRPRGRKRQRAERLGGRPLFLVTGPPGSAMTQALRESGLALSSGDLPGSSGRGEGCDWYFYEKAAYVAVHGLYAAPAGGEGSPGPAGGVGRDPEAARRVLVELLAATGRRIPLQGIMIAIPAALLRPEREKELKDLGLETWSILNEVASELDFRPPIYLLVTLLDEDAGWAAVLERVERKGAPAGALVNYSDRRTVGGRVAAKRAADALEGEILGLLDEILEEEPGVIGPCLTAVAETESLRHPLEVFCEALSNPSPITPPHRIQGIFAARIPRYEGYREDASGDAAGDPLADPARAGRAAAPHHEVAPKGREWRPPSGDGGGQPAAADVHAGIPGSLPGAGGGLPGRPAVTLAATDVHAVIPGSPPGAGGGSPAGRPALRLPGTSMPGSPVAFRRRRPGKGRIPPPVGRPSGGARPFPPRPAPCPRSRSRDPWGCRSSWGGSSPRAGG